jgi:hypothetical protein
MARRHATNKFMVWKAYQLIFRLRSPLHVGCGKIGNLQRTRSYVTGRVFWGALTMRLTRDAANGGGPADESRQYKRFADDVHRFLAYTYFYPALKTGTTYRVVWPWQDESCFRHRFLSSYSGTALCYPQQSAATGMLHEVEFLSPRTLDTGEPVFLAGYVFEGQGCSLAWKEACKRMQLGGERGYGWGNLEHVETSEQVNEDLFDGIARFDGREERPRIALTGSQPSRSLLAHTLAGDLPASGEVEPLVGREWRSHNARYRFAGQHIEFNGVCFAPGSTVDQLLEFSIGDHGLWSL